MFFAGYNFTLLFKEAGLNEVRFKFLASDWTLVIDWRGALTNHALPHSGKERPASCCLSLSLAAFRLSFRESKTLSATHSTSTHPLPTAPATDSSLSGPRWSEAEIMHKLLLLAAFAGFSWASDVVDLTDDDFESKIGGHDLILVEFFAPWWVSFMHWTVFCHMMRLVQIETKWPGLAHKRYGTCSFKCLF